MCGICGFTGNNYGSLINRMTSLLDHRGPDNIGYYSDSEITLGHTRLSIVDLSENGNQPMANHDNSIILIANGEIYNYQDLRQTLEDRKHVFQSESDSEVILHGYEEYGTNIIKHLNGMFAFAIWDKTQKILILARDRLGIKPVYYSLIDGDLIFASEIKAILAHPKINRLVNHHSLIDYITFENILGDKTLFDKIHLLQPGNFLTLKNGFLNCTEYWDVEFKTYESTVSEKITRFKKVAEQSVKNHLMSDVPLASYLSGGYDSTSVATIASEQLDNSISTFTGRFDDGDLYDETPYANLVAERIQSNHETITITPKDFIENIRNIIYHLDETKVGPGVFPQYMVAKAAAKSVRVILTGHGGDELFAGYPVHKSIFIQQAIRSRGFDILKIGQLLKKSEIPFFIYFAFLSKWKRLIRHGLPILFHRNEWNHIFTHNFYEKVKNIPADLSIRSLINSKRHSEIDRLQYLYLKTYLPSLFVVEDKIGMAHSLESRTPLCDNQMVDFALSIPFEQKIWNNELKYIIKEGMKDRLPNILYQQPKRGFPTPIDKWFRSELIDFLHDTLLSKKAISRNLFDPKYVSSILDRHRKTKHKTPFSEIRAHKIWILLNIELWFQTFID